MSVHFELIKEKIKEMSYSDADRYVDKMYNNGLLTTTQLNILDDYIIEKFVDEL